MQTSMKPDLHSVRTSRGMCDVSRQERSYSLAQPYLNMKRESKENTIVQKVVPSKSSGQNVRKPWPGNNRTCRGDDDDDVDNELVKYMSNLPGFLQQMEKKSNIQDKALNFGVLDWKRLEKWKYTEQMPGKYPSRKKQSSSSHVGIPNSLHIGKPAASRVSRFDSPQRQSTPYHGTYLSKEGKYKSDGKETCNQEYGRLRDDFRRRVEFYEEIKCPKNEKLSEKETSPSQQGRRKFSPAQHRKGSEAGLDEVNLTFECNPSDPQTIVLVKPKHFQKSSSGSSQLTESRTSLDGELAETTGNRLSDFFYSQELIPGDLSISGAVVGPNNSVAPHRNDLDNHEETAGPSSFNVASNEKLPEMAECLEPKERASSPARRFSFNLGKMSRSLSFKDNSALPQLSAAYPSVKSGPARPEISSSVDNFKNKQTNACGRAKSSPLRRLLDPLLKHKGARIAAAVPTGTKGPSQDRKPEWSNSQSLLQVSLKNGLPFFKLVVNNSNDMLAAAVKTLPTSGKSDSCMIYAFYSVHEVMKKSTNWMNQGSKSKSCGLGYDIVGQMKISGSSESDARECVLHGVDPGQVDKQTLEYVPNEEIAAVIVRKSSRMRNGGEFSDKTLGHEENQTCSGIVVILPDGVHGMPIEGRPTSLVSRGRFGGSCDCEGWDVGCKLRILAEDKKSNNSLQASMPSLTIGDHVNLYLEGGGKGKNPAAFSLKPFSNGYYSVEFNTSISLLEAFAACVAYITCSKFPEITDSKSPSGPEHFPEEIGATDKRRTPSTFQDQLPAYVTCPPLSPAGRI
ncbi:hypothetical protein OROHE_013251 [Orobanche hederae]